MPAKGSKGIKISIKVEGDEWDDLSDCEFPEECPEIKYSHGLEEMPRINNLRSISLLSSLPSNIFFDKATNKLFFIDNHRLYAMQMWMEHLRLLSIKEEITKNQALAVFDELVERYCESHPTESRFEAAQTVDQEILAFVNEMPDGFIGKLNRTLIKRTIENIRNHAPNVQP